MYHMVDGASPAADRTGVSSVIVQSGGRHSSLGLSGVD